MFFDRSSFWTFNAHKEIGSPATKLLSLLECIVMPEIEITFTLTFEKIYTQLGKDYNGFFTHSLVRRRVDDCTSNYKVAEKSIAIFPLLGESKKKSTYSHFRSRE